MLRVKSFILFTFFLFTASLTIKAQKEEQVNSKIRQAASEGFIENKGQIVDLEYKPNPSVLYLLNTPGLNIHLRQTGFSYDVYTISEKPLPAKLTSETKQGKFEIPDKDVTWYFQRVDIELVGCNSNALIEGKGKSNDYLNYYTAGTPEQGVTNVHTYSEVYYYNIYNKIDLQFLVKDGKLKYNFILHPGVKIEDIKLQFNGASKTELTEMGEIKIITKAGTLLETIPESYYINKKAVDIKFKYFSKNIFVFDGKYLNSNTLIIDPSPYRIWGSYYGGTNPEEGYDICTDKKLNVYLVGVTESLQGIASAGHQDTFGGNKDAFVVKFDGVGKRKWATYYGGDAEDIGKALCVDKDFNPIITGTTKSYTNISYNGHQNSHGGIGDNFSDEDGFVAKFDSAGIRLWATYYGEKAPDYSNSISTDKSGNIFMSGSTGSKNNIAFNGHQDTIGNVNGYNAFLVKFDSTGTRQWGTYYGGKSGAGLGVCNDNDGNCYLTGTASKEGDIAFNGFKNNSKLGGGFLAKFTTNGKRIWGTFYTGSSYTTQPNAVEADSKGNVYIAGITDCKDSIAYNGHQNNLSSTVGEDAFLVKFDSSGHRLWGTYYGGKALDWAYGVGLDNYDNVYLVGRTSSTENIAYKGYLNTHRGSSSAFLAKFDSTGIRHWGTYYNGEKNEQGRSVAFDTLNDVYLAGTAWSQTGIAYNGHQDTISGFYKQDAFLVKFYEPELRVYEPKLSYCAGDTLSVDFVIRKLNIDSGNRYIIDLSDSSGMFTSPTGIGHLDDTIKSGQILLSLPSNLKTSLTYRIRLRSTDTRDTGYASGYFTVFAKAKAAFNTNNSQQCFNNNLFQFTNTSKIDSGGIKFFWDFGDNDTSSLVNPIKIYNNYGSYKVRLVTISDFNCIDTFERSLTVVANPMSNFNINKDIQCYNNNSFVFTNTSSIPSGTYTSYWTFGDNGTSTQKSPSKTYGSLDSFVVRLIVTSTIGSCKDTISKSILILPSPKSSFSLNSNVSQCIKDNSFSFTNSSNISLGSINSFWNFGDNTFDSIHSPTKSYSSFGSYTISLVIKSDKGCSDSTTKTVNVNPNPQAQFSIDDSTKCINEGFKFTNNSITPQGTFNSFWQVGSNSSTINNPTIVLSTPGTYKAQLTVRITTTGCSDSIEESITVLPLPNTSPISGPATSKGKKQETYSVAATTGSSYTWSAIGGIIISGQGTNQIIVKWNENSGATGQVSVIEKDKEGCSGNAIKKTVSLSPSGVNTIQNIYNAVVFPNPNAGLLNIDIGDYSGKYDITIFNSIGQQVLVMSNLNNNSSVNLEKLSNGVYFINIKGENLNSNQKIVIQKQ